MEKAYLDFLRYCLHPAGTLPETVHSIDWMDMMDWAEQQAIVGVVFEGIQKAGNDLNISFDPLMEWIGYAQQIVRKSSLVNRRCADISAYIARCREVHVGKNVCSQK